MINLKDDYILCQRSAKVYPVLKELFPQRITSLCHYTSTEVLDKLLESATFRASNLFYLNDSSEYECGIKQLKKTFDSYPKPLKLLEEITSSKVKPSIGLFSVSFSTKEDILQQWITYAKESGVCIELDGKLLKKVAIKTISKQKNAEDSFEHSNCNIRHQANDVIRKIKYGDLQIEPNYIIKLFSSICDDSTVCDIDKNEIEKIDLMQALKSWDDYSWFARLYLQLIASYIKNNDFKGEQEIRAMFFAEKDGEEDCNKSEIKYYRMDTGVLRPYCEITFCEDSSDAEPLLPLKTITVGPSGTQQVVFDSTIHRIKYGKNNLWDYYTINNKVFINNFLNYVYLAIERCVNDNCLDVDVDTANKIFNYLKKDWENENKKIIDATEDDFEKKLSSASFIKSFAPQKKVDNTTLIYNEIIKSNYFSKEGIWIKKSKIPYIF